MRVLAGGPARECESAVFGLHLEGLEAQGLDVHVQHQAVREESGGPRWTSPKIEAVAGVRQEMMEEALADFDALWLVDTDVVCGPGVLERMLAVDADVVYGVFWTDCDWGGRQGLWPQVWQRHPYGFTDAELLKDEGEVEVVGGGACTLIRGHALLECRYSPILEGLKGAGGMWGGEDRTFALHCETRGIRQVALLGLPIEHMYDSTDVAAAREKVGL